MTGGAPSVDLRRAGTIAVTVAWPVLVIVLVIVLGVVPGILVGGWGLPMGAGVVLLGTHRLTQRRPRPAAAPKTDHVPVSATAA